MFSEPVIFSPTELSSRCYVVVYIDGKRIRLYNGKPLGIVCNPNHSTSLPARDKALRFLCHHLKMKLGKGWKPNQDKLTGSVKPKEIPTISNALTMTRIELSKENLSVLYERDLLSLCDHFLKYLKRNGLVDTPVTKIGVETINGFLQPYKTTATNYMNRRRTLSSLFSRLITKDLIPVNPVQLTGKLKQSAYLNLPYKKKQLREVLDEIKQKHDQLYLCCLLVYGSLLRPHQEVRLLKRGSFNEDLTVISLSGDQNKSRRIRCVHIPGYVHDELIKQGVDQLTEDRNIFSGDSSPFNMSYFNTAWSRIKEDLMERGIVSQNHTLYSFRHTAAVNMYLKTKDPYKIQQAFAHSSLRVTLLYLRNLGLVVDSSLEDLPDL